MYCTVDEVERYLRMTFDNVQRQHITDVLIPAAESYIDRVCSRSFAPPETDEVLTVDGADGFAVLPKSPVQSLTSVKVDDYEITDYKLADKSGIIYSNAIYPGKLNVTVTGKFGFSKVPASISHACTRLVAEYLKPYLTEGFGIKTSQEQDSRVEFDSVVENNPDILKTLKRWKRW